RTRPSSGSNVNPTATTWGRPPGASVVSVARCRSRRKASAASGSAAGSKPNLAAGRSVLVDLLEAAVEEVEGFGRHGDQTPGGAGNRPGGVAQRREGGVVGRAGGHGLPEAGQLHEVVGEEDVLLGGEVAEERPAGHVGLGGDIVDRHRVEAPLSEQPEGGRLEFGGGQPLSAFPQTGAGSVNRRAVFGHVRSPYATVTPGVNVSGKEG